MLPLQITSIIDWKCALVLTHLLTGNPMWVDFEYIMAAREHPEGHVVLFLAGGSPIAIAHTPKELGEKISELPERCRTGAVFDVTPPPKRKVRPR